MTREEAIRIISGDVLGTTEQTNEAVAMAVEALRTIEKQQHDGCLNCDHFDVVRQIQWERDLAIQQLKELGYGLGEKIRADGDTISRQDAVDALYKMLHDCFWADDEELDAVITTLNELPSAQRWVSVSERLPKAEHGEGEDLLCQLENMRRIVLYFDGGNWCYPSGEPYIGVNYENGWSNKVVAWMPLPEPWKGEDE